MTQAASLWVKLGLSDKDFADGLKRAENQLNRFGNRLSSIGSRLTVGLSLPLALVSGAAVKLGMDAVESENLFTVSMGKMADSARAWSQDLRKQLGLNEYELRKNVGVFNVMLNSMGIGEKAAFDMSKGLTKLAYDMASFYNLNPDEAFQKLQSGISGEVEPLKRLGIIVNETTAKTWALNNGIIRQGQEMSEAQKVMARYGAIMEQTSKAQGDLARTMDSPANRLRILQEQLKMAATDLGVALLPAVTGFMQAVTPLVQRLSEMAQWFGQLPEPIRNTVAQLLMVTIAVGPLTLAIGKMVQGWSALIGFFRLLPTLKIGLLFSDIAVYMTGAVTGAWSLSSAMGALAVSFTPFMAGGAIALALWGIVKIFQRMNDEARLAGMNIANMQSVADVQERIRELKTARQYAQEKYKGTFATFFIGDRSRSQARSEAQTELTNLDTELAKLTKRLEELLNPKLPTVTIPGYTPPDVSGVSGGSNNYPLSWEDYTAQQRQQRQSEEYQRRIDQGNIPGQPDNSYYRMMEESVRQQAESARVASMAADNTTNFGEQLSLTSELLGGFSGPLGEAANALKSLIDNSLNLADQFKNISFERSETNPLGAFGGILQTVGLISGVAGLIQGIGSLFDNSAAAAEAQQRAAEEWRRFLSEASASELFGRRDEIQTNFLDEQRDLERQLKELQRQYDDLGNANLGSSAGYAAEDLLRQMQEIRDRLAEIGAEAAEQLEDLNEQLQRTLGIAPEDLLRNLQDAFNAADLTEFQSRLHDSLQETIRNAVINGFLSAQIVQPLTDALMAAFNSPYMVNGINTFISPDELAALQALQEQLFGQASNLYEILDQLGLGLGNLSDATNQATASMRNVPTGFKVNLNRYSAADGISSINPPPATILPPQSGGSTGGSVTVNFNGDVYGMDDFERKVQQISGSYLSRLNTMQYGVGGVR